MTDDAALRELHRIVDLRTAQWWADHAQTAVRGLVTEVNLRGRTMAARLDLGSTATPNIAIPAGLYPVEGDDVLVNTRADGFRVCLAILGRASTIGAEVGPDEPAVAVAPLSFWLDTDDDAGYSYTIGTSFPPAPKPWERCFRTDIRGGMLFLWHADLGYWLSDQLFVYAVTQWGVGVSGAADARLPRPDPDFDVYVYEWWADMYVASTNDGTRYWTLLLMGTAGSYSAFPTLSTISNAPNTVVRERAAVNALAGFTTEWLQFHATPVGATPGNFYGPAAFSYRLRAT